MLTGGAAGVTPSQVSTSCVFFLKKYLICSYTSVLVLNTFLQGKLQYLSWNILCYCVLSIHFLSLLIFVDGPLEESQNQYHSWCENCMEQAWKWSSRFDITMTSVFISYFIHMKYEITVIKMIKLCTYILKIWRWWRGLSGWRELTQTHTEQLFTSRTHVERMND